MTIEPLRDAAGALVGLTCASSDITELREKTDRLQMLLEISQTLASRREFPEMFAAIASCIRPVFRNDVAWIALHDAAINAMRYHALDAAPGESVWALGMTVPLHESSSAHAFLSRQTKVLGRADLAGLQSPVADHLLSTGIEWLACIPLQMRAGVFGTFNLGRKQGNAFDAAELELLKQIADLVAIAIDNARAYQEIAELKDKLQEEKLYLEGEIQEEMHFGEIIGESQALKEVIAQAKVVAPSDATVLLLGETGTGKELIARAIHRMSARKDNSFIKLNCAAIPSGLLESELFGHEKGAFTGAVSQKLGRLELADHGTLFLDEIGEIPLELQPKLLRVLQDHEFERLGSTRTLHVDVRVIAATNRDLIKSVAEREFRSDLFYRLNVFPIRLPTLRERREDIPKLALYFVQKYAARMNKTVEGIPNRVVNALTRWEWPGNIRELENFIERSVILTDGNAFRAPVGELKVKLESSSEGTLEAREREHIVRVLQETHGMIAGPTGAAARLGLKRTTLQSKLQRMGIKAREYRSGGPI